MPTVTHISPWTELLKFRCTGCGNCCTDTVVVCTDADVRRIMKGTGLKAEQIVRFVKPDDVDGGREGNGWIIFPTGWRVMALRRSNGQCKFLKKDRCTVYEHRPMTCRMYPFNLFLDETGRHLVGLSINDAVECPYELDGKNTRKELLRADRIEDEQDDAYWEKVEEWNDEFEGGKQKDFLEFLGLA